MLACFSSFSRPPVVGVSHSKRQHHMLFTLLCNIELLIPSTATRAHFTRKRTNKKILLNHREVDRAEKNSNHWIIFTLWTFVCRPSWTLVYWLNPLIGKYCSKAPTLIAAPLLTQSRLTSSAQHEASRSRSSIARHIRKCTKFTLAFHRCLVGC